MTIEELKKYRNYKLESLKDDSEFISSEEFGKECLYFMNASQLTDSDELDEAYYESKIENFKVVGYLINESGERLQLFIANLPLDNQDDSYIISRKEYYDTFFSSSIKFLRQSIKGELNTINDTEPIKPLVNKLNSQEELFEIDVVEIFILSGTISIDNRGNGQLLKKFEFNDEDITVKIEKCPEGKKTITVKKTLIDFNFLYKVETSQEPREPLQIDFKNKYKYTLECLPAAKEEDYESYITVIPGNLLQKLYYDHSSRLLERNVRAFLQFKKGANKNMRDTIRKSPEKFLAYNNGLTITATDGEIKKINGHVVIESLYDFQIVNGGQTTATIYFTGKEDASLDKVKVFAKINIIRTKSEDDLEELVKSISINSNTQTKVTNVDLDSRSPYLRKLKEISEAVVTPDGKKWFFEKAKGEYFTELNITKTSPRQFLRDHPKERVLTKEQLAKYFVAWGDKPFLVKKGGEKVFKDFMAILKGTYRSPNDIGNSFFEDLVSKVILFRELESLYGTRSKAIGQIRSATVPYAVALIYLYTQREDAGLSYFNLSEIWKYQKLSKGFSEFCLGLMKVVNKRIVDNRLTDDVNEDTKKEELWKKIKRDSYIKDFFGGLHSQAVLKKMLMTENQYKDRYEAIMNNDICSIKEISADTWFALSKWAKENDKFEGKERKFLFDIGRILSQERNLSQKQAKWALDLYTIALEEGFSA
ncbi:MAG TPA: AIPR family protein [Phnomibacter sp.]|nr:AIPR family protein [Phnomibacter sp.]